MSWLQILHLVATLMQQATMAFAQGERKEAVAQVSLDPEHVETLKALTQQV